MSELVILAGVTLWPGLLLSPRLGTAVSVKHIQTAGRTVTQRHSFGAGNHMFLSCSLDGGKLRGGKFTYSQLVQLVAAKDAGIAVPFTYRDTPEKQVLIVTVPENPVRATINPEQAPDWHYSAWYTGQVQLIEV